jgi:iron complex outermembrane receptor protein
MRLFEYKPVTAVLFIGLSAHKVYAANYPSEQDYFQQFPVVLSASRLYQPLSEVPSAITVIDRKMIEASGFRKIPDLFKLVPGMYVSYYKGSQAIVSYHGVTDQYARRMQVMIDGSSVYLPPNNTVDWADLPFTIDDIERIEVIRGPAAASYGANSTQGVINIITKDAGAGYGRSISVTRGAKGINDLVAHFGKLGESFDYGMTLVYTADSGYDNLSVPPNNIPKADELLNNSYDDNQARLVNYNASYYPSGTDRLDFRLGFNHDVQEVGFTDKNPSPANPSATNGNPPHNLFANSSFVQLVWTRTLARSSDLSLRYFHSQENQHEAFPVFLSGVYYPGPVVQTLNTARDQVEVQHTISTSPHNRLVYGANYQRNQVTGQSIMPPLSLFLSLSQDTENLQVFGEDAWRVNKWLLVNVGDMYERDDFGHQYSSPRVSLNWNVTPEQTLRIGISVAYRSPALNETNRPAIQPGTLIIPSTTATSPNLRNERLESHEFGYVGEFAEWATLLDLRLFSDHLTYGIVPNSGTGTFVNDFFAEYHGFEATLKKSWSNTSTLTINFSHDLAGSNGPTLATEGNSFMASASPFDNDILAASIPKYSASLLYSQPLARDYSFSTSYYFQDSLQPFDRGPRDYQPIQHRMDLRIARAFHADRDLKGEVALVVQNVFNQAYTEYVANNVFSQTWFATVTAGF